MAALEESLAGKVMIALTWLPREGMELGRAVLDPEGDFVFASDWLTEPELVEARAGALRGDWVENMPDGIFVEVIAPPQRFFVLGAGDDAKPLVKSMAALLGRTVSVIDGRAQLARPERFPEAERVSVVSAGMTDVQTIRAEDAVVLMTQSYEQDRELLAAVLPLRPRYLGLLGARHRSSLLVREVAATLGWTVADCCGQIHAPVGLDLGGDGPESDCTGGDCGDSGVLHGKGCNFAEVVAGRYRKVRKRGWDGALSAGAVCDGCCVMRVGLRTQVLYGETPRLKFAATVAR